MKTRTIEKVIRDKINEWAESIKNPHVREMVKTKTMVSGGCIASMLLKEKVNDFDVYFATPTVAMNVALYYATEMINAGAYNVVPQLRFIFDTGAEIYNVVPNSENDHPLFDASKPPTGFKRVEVYVKSQGFAAEGTETKEYKYFESLHPEKADDFINSDEAEDDGKAKYRPVFMSSNAITLSNGVQLVLRFTGTPAEIHKNFDFVHCTNYWTPKDGLVLNVDALGCILGRELRYVGSLFPLSSIFRARKFIQRGWTCHVGNYLKMAMQLNELDLYSPSVLEEQLTGMDAAYLMQIIHATRSAAANGATIDQTYMMTLIDRLMGSADGGGEDANH